MAEPASLSARVPVHAKPTRAELLAAHNSETVPDLVGPQLRILLVGINPGLYSGATGHHFAKPGNRFWPALHGCGLTPRLLRPSEERELLGFGIGITKFIHRATATAAELSTEELRAGGARVRLLVRRLKPRSVAFLGVGAYGQAYGVRKVEVGPAPGRFEGAALWVLPNPSGLNANYQLPDFVRLFAALRDSVRGEEQAPSRGHARSRDPQ
jgi:double-stranded uracil-DNA glycosylase